MKKLQIKDFLFVLRKCESCSNEVSSQKRPFKTKSAPKKLLEEILNLLICLF